MRPGKISAATLTSVLALGLLALGAAGALAANPGNPAQFNATASVNILKPLSITQLESMSFGKVVGPIGASASNTYLVNAPGSVSVTGTGGGSHISGGDRDQFRIEGADGHDYIFSGAPGGACSDAKVVLNRPSFSATFTLGSGGVAFWELFGEITITNAADGTGPLGVVTCPYTITVQYP